VLGWRNVALFHDLASSFERTSNGLCRQLRMCARAHSADAFEAAVLFKPRRIFILWFGGVRVFVCDELAAAEWPKKRT
jgi:hypothetical protein